MFRRPRVITKVGSPIDVRALVANESAAEPTVEQVREAADVVMERLIDLVEELRGQTAPHPAGAPRAGD